MAQPRHESEPESESEEVFEGTGSGQERLEHALELSPEQKRQFARRTVKKLTDELQWKPGLLTDSNKDVLELVLARAVEEPLEQICRRAYRVAKASFLQQAPLIEEQARAKVAWQIARADERGDAIAKDAERHAKDAEELRGEVTGLESEVRQAKKVIRENETGREKVEKELEGMHDHYEETVGALKQANQRLTVQIKGRNELNQNLEKEVGRLVNVMEVQKGAIEAKQNSQNASTVIAANRADVIEELMENKNKLQHDFEVERQRWDAQMAEKDNMIKALQDSLEDEDRSPLLRGRPHHDEGPPSSDPVEDLREQVADLTKVNDLVKMEDGYRVRAKKLPPPTPTSSTTPPSQVEGAMHVPLDGIRQLGWEDMAKRLEKQCDKLSERQWLSDAVRPILVQTAKLKLERDAPDEPLPDDDEIPVEALLGAVGEMMGWASTEYSDRLVEAVKLVSEVEEEDGNTDDLEFKSEEEEEARRAWFQAAQDTILEALEHSQTLHRAHRPAEEEVQQHPPEEVDEQPPTEVDEQPPKDVDEQPSKDVDEPTPPSKLVDDEVLKARLDLLRRTTEDGKKRAEAIAKLAAAHKHLEGCITSLARETQEHKKDKLEAMKTLKALEEWQRMAEEYQADIEAENAALKSYRDAKQDEEVKFEKALELFDEIGEDFATLKQQLPSPPSSSPAAAFSGPNMMPAASADEEAGAHSAGGYFTTLCHRLLHSLVQAVADLGRIRDAAGLPSTMARADWMALLPRQTAKPAEPTEPTDMRDLREMNARLLDYHDSMEGVIEQHDGLSVSQEQLRRFADLAASGPDLATLRQRLQAETDLAEKARLDELMGLMVEQERVVRFLCHLLRTSEGKRVDAERHTKYRKLVARLSLAQTRLGRALDAMRDDVGKVELAHLLHFLVLSFFCAATVAEGRKYAAWRSANAVSRGMFVNDRHYTCVGVPHLAFFFEWTGII